MALFLPVAPPINWAPRAHPGGNRVRVEGPTHRGGPVTPLHFHICRADLWENEVITWPVGDNNCCDDMARFY